MTNHQDTDPISGYPAPPNKDTSTRAGFSIGTAISPASRFFNQRKCGYCGHDFGHTVPIAICDECDRQVASNQEREREERRQKEIAARMARWAGMAGKFASAAPTKLPFECQRTLLDRWRPGTKFGATITGSGGGKSWLLWLMLKKAHAARREFDARVATEMRGAIMALARNGDTAPSLRRLTTVPILAIDDFGLATPTPAADELWAKILEVRAAAGRPTLIVTPYEGENLLDRFSDPTAAMKISRLIGDRHGWVLDTTAQQLHPPTGR